MKKIALLNSPIITAEGTFIYRKISADEAKRIITGADSLENGIGYTSTAEAMSRLFDFPIPKQRVLIHQLPGDSAVVFDLKLRERLPRGKVLSLDEIEEIGYEFGLLSRTE